MAPSVLNCSGQNLSTLGPDHPNNEGVVDQSSGEDLSTLESTSYPLSAAALAAALPGAQKSMLRERLLSDIRRFQPLRAERLAGVLLHADNLDILDLLESGDKLKAKVSFFVANLFWLAMPMESISPRVATLLRQTRPFLDA